jgi:Dolichyl-phosphate-mannose-protein mannosyltransferase
MRAAAGRRAGLVHCALACLAVLYYIAWEIAHRGVYAYDQGIYQISDADEWRYTACSRLVARGYVLFDQVFSAQPPLLFLSLAAGIRTVSDSIDGARWVEIAFGLLLLLSLGWLAWLLWDRTIAVVAMALLAVSPGFLIYSHTVEAEVPMTALATLSLALVALYARNRRLLVCSAAGIVLAAAVLMKFFAFEAIVPALALLWNGRPARLRDSLRPATVFVLSVLVPVALELAVVSPARQWQQVVDMHDRAASIAFPNGTPAPKIVGQFLTLDLGMTVLAGAGLLILLLSRRRRCLAFSASWLLGSCAMLLAFHPLFQHHAAILVAPLALAAGVGAVEGLRALVGRKKSVGMVGVAALLAYLISVPRLAHADRHALYAGDSSLEGRIAAYIDTHSSTSDMVAVDDLRLADMAHRFVPPPLCDPSDVRRLAGYLTSADLISATEQYRPRLVVISFGTFGQFPRYVSWLAGHYRSDKLDNNVTVYTRR